MINGCMKSNDIPGTEDARYLSSMLLNKTINLATNSQATVIILPSTVPQEDDRGLCGVPGRQCGASSHL
jgi:hypothetical protein